MLQKAQIGVDVAFDFLRFMERFFKNRHVLILTLDTDLQYNKQIFEGGKNA
ncbi:MAG: hypothetical protein FD155_1820 [Bacteroidetes bacterium]|jgi:hypothetical protein|nr:MAG: hypothetical protein FD155_1820 [Bacteroidota bacterium]